MCPGRCPQGRGPGGDTTNSGGPVSHLKTSGETALPADIELVRGTLDLFVLKTLTWRPMHGLAIARWIDHVTDSGLQIEEGALYTALHRMEQRGWINGEWSRSENGRRARYYKLTAAGRRAYTSRLATWNRYTALAGRILAAQEATT